MDISADKQISKKSSIKAKLILLTVSFALFSGLFFALSQSLTWCRILAFVCINVFYQLFIRSVVYCSVQAIVRREKEPVKFTDRGKKLFKLMGVRFVKSKFPPVFPIKFDIERLEPVIMATRMAQVAHAIVVPLGFVPLFAALIVGKNIASTAFAALFCGLIDFWAFAVASYNLPRLIALKYKITERASSFSQRNVK